jgi:hypothetical protein
VFAPRGDSHCEQVIGPIMGGYCLTDDTEQQRIREKGAQGGKRNLEGGSERGREGRKDGGKDGKGGKKGRKRNRWFGSSSFVFETFTYCCAIKIMAM